MVTSSPAARPRCLPSLSAIAASVSRTRSSPRSESASSHAEAIQLENVVRRTHQRPFTLHLLESPQQELPKATRLLDLSDDRLDDPFARCIDGGAGLREQLAGHPVD